MPAPPETFRLAHGAWSLVTRLGEAQILLPAMLAALVWLARAAHARPAALWWAAATALAALVTTATKVAFIGFELGYAPLNFTGVSGHAMFAAAVLPVLARIAGATATPRARRLSVAAGCLLAALIAWSRVQVGAHSPSEVVAGIALGGSASMLALRHGHFPRLRVPPLLTAGLLLWMLLLPVGAPPSRTHDWVTRLALALSDRAKPYTRYQMLRDHRLAQQRQAAGPSGAPAGPDGPAQR